jgi:hypothetical protein
MIQQGSIPLPGAEASTGLTPRINLKTRNLR